MKKVFICFAAVLFFGSCGSSSKLTNTRHPEFALGWKLGAQAYTFNRYTFFEAIDKIKASDLNYVEAYPGQGTRWWL
jgi:hypothetical protein